MVLVSSYLLSFCCYYTILLIYLKVSSSSQRLRSWKYINGDGNSKTNRYTYIVPFISALSAEDTIQRPTLKSIFLSTLGIEPRALHMTGKCHTTELCSQVLVFQNAVFQYSLSWFLTWHPVTLASRALRFQPCATTLSCVLIFCCKNHQSVREKAQEAERSRTGCSQEAGTDHPSLSHHQTRTVDPRAGTGTQTTLSFCDI